MRENPLPGMRRIYPAGLGRPHVSDGHIHQPPRGEPVPKSPWCVVIHRRSPPEETARIVRSARAERQHTERAPDAGDGEVTETSHYGPRTDRSGALRLSRSSFSKASYTLGQCSDKPWMRTSSAHLAGRWTERSVLPHHELSKRA